MRRQVAVVCPGVGEGGGVANVVLHHARELARDFDVLLISDSFPAASTPGVTFVPVRKRQHGWLRRFAHVPNLLSFAFAARRALRLQSSLACTIVHSHLLGLIAARPLRDVPWALVTHGDIFTRPSGTFDPLVTWLYRIVEPIAFRQASMVIAISQPLADIAVRSGAKRQSIRRVPNGIDLEEFIETTRGADQTPLPLLYVGRLSVEKGPDLLLDACRILRGRQVPFRLDVVGDGPLDNELRAQVLSADIQGDVEFHGVRTRDEIKEFLGRSAVLCVPSRSDAQPLVVLEALASGVPVIGSNVEGIPSMVLHETNGLLTTPDAASLADAIQRLHEDRALLARMAAAARHSIIAFQWSRLGSHLRHAVLELIAT